MSSIVRAIGLGAVAGLSTYGYHRSGQNGWLGERMPYMRSGDDKKAAGIVLAVASLGYKRNVTVGIAAGTTAFLVTNFFLAQSNHDRRQPTGWIFP